jgi:uncharacterized protein (DUF433 family)
MKRAVVCRNPEVMGGTPVFCGTRVPVQTLLDYLEAGESIDDFLAGFPSVSREQVIEFLEAAKDRLLETVE